MNVSEQLFSLSGGGSFILVAARQIPLLSAFCNNMLPVICCSLNTGVCVCDCVSVSLTLDDFPLCLLNVCVKRQLEAEALSPSCRGVM